MGLEWIGFRQPIWESFSPWRKGCPRVCAGHKQKRAENHVEGQIPWRLLEPVGQGRVRSYRNPGTTIPVQLVLPSPSAFFFSRSTHQGKKACHPQHLALSQPGEGNRRGGSWAAGSLGNTLSPCKHPIPRRLGSDGTTRLEVISDNKDFSQKRPPTHLEHSIL